MAASDRVTSAARYILEGDVARNRPNSEAINQKIAGSVNILLDRAFYTQQDLWQGYITSQNTGDLGGFRVPNTVDISYYEMNINDIGSSGTTSINYNVYDATGAFVNTLFGVEPSIGGGSSSRVSIGSDVANSADFDVNTTGITFNVGTLNLTQLLAGYTLYPDITGFAQSSRGMRFLMRLKEV